MRLTPSTRSNPHKPSRAALLTLLAAAATLPIDSMLQAGGSSAPWNRRIDAVAVIPAAGGKQDVHVVWSLDVALHSTPLDLSMSILLFKNGGEVPFAVKSLAINIPPGGFCGATGCGGGCGTGFIDGINSAAFLCIDADGDGDCGCSMPPIAAEFPGQEIEPGDVLTVLLVPNAGALGEPDDADDAQTFAFSGPRYWDRDIDSAVLVPVPGAPRGWAVQLSGSGGWKAIEHDLDLGMQATIRKPSGEVLGIVSIQGSATSSDPLACGGVGCGGLCGNWNGFQVDCTQQNWITGCLCGGGWLALWFDPESPLEPGDQILVSLTPGLGSLPVLSGTGGDDTKTFTLALVCPADLTGDGLVNGADLAIVLGNWGGAGLGDLNGDGEVNAADLAVLLGAWGPCIAV